MTATAAPEFSLTVITKGADCVQCTGTERSLKKKGLLPEEHYEVLDANLDENKAIGHELGYAQAPVLLVKDADGNLVDSWSGFNPGKVGEWAPQLVGPAEEELLLAA